VWTSGDDWFLEEDEARALSGWLRNAAVRALSGGRKAPKLKEVGALSRAAPVVAPVAFGPIGAGRVRAPGRTTGSRELAPGRGAAEDQREEALAVALGLG